MRDFKTSIAATVAFAVAARPAHIMTRNPVVLETTQKRGLEGRTTTTTRTSRKTTGGKEQQTHDRQNGQTLRVALPTGPVGRRGGQFGGLVVGGHRCGRCCGKEKEPFINRKQQQERKKRKETHG